MQEVSQPSPHHQGSEKWGRFFPDKDKSHGQFGAKTTYKTDGQTERQRDRQPDRQVARYRQSDKDSQTVRRLTERLMDRQ